MPVGGDDTGASLGAGVGVGGGGVILRSVAFTAGKCRKANEA